MRLTSRSSGLLMELPHDGHRPGLRLESSRSRRVRLVAGGNSVFWARIERGYYGVWTMRPAVRPPIVSAIRADEARSMVGIDGWMRWFARELQQSERSPLSGGRWNLTELAENNAYRGAHSRHTLFPVGSEDGLPAPALRLRNVLERPRVTYEDWGSNGSAGILPLRDASCADSARVKSWMKHARNGSLPPLLLWWVGVLDSHLLLDGHDRLAAALQVGVEPRVLTLWQSIDEVYEPNSAAQAAFVKNYEALFENPDVQLAARQRLNATLIAKYRDTWRRSVTRAQANPELDTLWEVEVRAIAASHPGIGTEDLLADT